MKKQRYFGITRRDFMRVGAVGFAGLTFRDFFRIRVASAAATPITFHDIARGGGAGITYGRVPSTNLAGLKALIQQPFTTLMDIPKQPMKPYGAPGVAIFDYDGDGYLDIYVTNGPGQANSLYRNLLGDTGKLQFVDMAVAAGVDATSQDSTGCCFGDIDNDGHQDLLVLGRSEPNFLFRNLGNGRFQDITAASGVGGGNLSHTSAAMGDINGDGLLDIVVANTFDWTDSRAEHTDPFDLNQPNQLYRNMGGGVFMDVSDSSGIRNLTGIPAGAGTITWAVAMVDYDLDGNLDIIHADDQGPMPNARGGGVDRGYVRVLKNDGTGHFTDVTTQVHTNITGGWMGLSFGDFNHDGQMDMFVSNTGDYSVAPLIPNYRAGIMSSQWFLGQPDHTFTAPGVGALVATPWGWSTSTLDYDNDGNTDIAFFGGQDLFANSHDSSNPGTLLHNDGTGQFTDDSASLDPATVNGRRDIQGAAVGDLNNDGFVDVVTVSSNDYPPPDPLVPYAGPPNMVHYGSPFDATANLIPMFKPNGTPGQFVWSGVQTVNGTLSVEVNSGGNGNGWVQVTVQGSKGVTPAGKVNRDGVGAVMFFTPDGGKPSMLPIQAGTGYASASSLRATFGLGSAAKGTVEVLWPGGGRTKVFDVKAGERMVVPELPSFMGASARVPFGYINLQDYALQVREALDHLDKAGMLRGVDQGRLLSSALRAHAESG